MFLLFDLNIQNTTTIVQGCRADWVAVILDWDEIILNWDVIIPD